MTTDKIDGFWLEDGALVRDGRQILARWAMKIVKQLIRAELDKETPYSVIEGEYTIARFFERELAEKFVKKMGHEFMRILPEEPKPWHDAKPGEVWVIQVENGGVGPEEPVTCVEEYGETWFMDPVADVRILVTGDIVSARRIWPES